MDLFLFVIIKLILIIWYMYKLNDTLQDIWLVMGNRHVRVFRKSYNYTLLYNTQSVKIITCMQFSLFSATADSCQ